MPKNAGADGSGSGPRAGAKEGWGGRGPWFGGTWCFQDPKNWEEPQKITYKKLFTIVYTAYT